VQHIRIYMGLHNKRHDRLLAVPVIGILSITLCGWVYMTFGGELLSEWSYISTPSICPYSMHRDTFIFNFIKHKETTRCKNDMLFICLICSSYVLFCQKTNYICPYCFLSGDWQFCFEKKGTDNCDVGN